MDTLQEHSALAQTAILEMCVVTITVARIFFGELQYVKKKQDRLQPTYISS